MKLFKKIGPYDIYKRLPDEEKEESKIILEKMKDISINDQKELATYFFDHSVMKEFNTKDAYKVYALLKGTAFSDYFKQLEDLRLRGYGYGGFAL